MKQILTITFALCLIPYAIAQQYGWTDISANMPAQGNLNDIHVIGEEIWITGWGDGVFYSPDGGETFQIQSLPENSGISSSVFMKNNQKGYVVTFLGNILKTDNGGTTWTTLHEPGGGLNSVHFPPNSDIGYACGSNGTVWSFDDISITDISPPSNASNLQSIYFPVDNGDGKICGETTIARYKNNSWNNLQLYDATLSYNSIFFIDNNTGWCVGTYGTIVHTIDGSSWVRKTSNTTQNLNDAFFINSDEGWTAGTEVLLHTLDGGETWTRELESQTVGKELRAIYFTSENNGYVVGNYTVLKYGEVSGINDRQMLALDFDVYPNPCSDKLQITSSKNQINSKNQNSKTKIEIINMVGKTVFEEEMGRVGEEVTSIDVSHLPAGLYLVKLQAENAVGVRKLIIQ